MLFLLLLVHYVYFIKENLRMDNNGRKLRELRNIFGVSQEEFGKKIGVTRSTIASYENENNPISVGTIRKIIEVTGLSFLYDYFQKNQNNTKTLKEYFEENQIDFRNLKFKNAEENLAHFFNGLKNFQKKEFTIDSIIHKMTYLNFILNENLIDCCFVKIEKNEALPFAKDQDILVVVESDIPEANDWIIFLFEKNILIARYLISGINEIILSNETLNFTFTKKDFEEKVEILGIVKSKISVEKF